MVRRRVARLSLARLWLAAALVGGALVACGAGRTASRDSLAAASPAPGPVLPTPSAQLGLSGAHFGNEAVGRLRFGLDVYGGLGAWLDVFDWSVSYAPNNRPEPTIGLSGIDDMANHGVRTLFIQTARYDNPADVLEPDRLKALVNRAHERGMGVVAWYLPTFVEPETDLRRMLLAASFGVDGLAVDIEARIVEDVAERTRRLVELSRRLRSLVGAEQVLGAIVLPATLIEDVNPNYWPGYPWAELGQAYNVFLPMNYWTNRLSTSPWRDAAASTAENIVRIRTRTGVAGMAVHTIGGSANRVTPAEVAAMVAANRAGGAIGGSLYDYATTPAELWPPLAGLVG